MKRRALALFVVALLLTTIGGAISSQVEELDPPTGYVRSDLQLISQESKETWSSAWSGPIQASTILAWLYEHGYPRLMRDFNEDGVIDELDTIELAHLLGGERMRADTTEGTTDPWLVVGLAEYVADLYPDEFVLKIYDLGFPGEFASEGLGTFAPDVIPGIIMLLEGEPTQDAYEYELETAEGVIVGLEERDDKNSYLSGRSYEFLESLLGLTPVGFAWAEENRLLPGPQGRILETVSKTEDRLYVDFRFGWTPVEFMLALSPREIAGFASMSYECPEDAVAYHVTTNSTPRGTVQIEECVIRHGDYDEYVWIVTNIDYEWLGCGICAFAVGHGGLGSVAHTGPPPWMFSEFGWMWRWQAPLGSCGIMPGETGVFSVTVPGPTVDVWVPAAITACVPSLGAGELILDGVPTDAARTTGPIRREEGDCPDLTVEITKAECSYDPGTGLWDIAVSVRVSNVGGVPVTTPFSVLIESDTHPASMAWGPAIPIADGGFVNGFAEYSVSSPTPPCPEAFTVTVDFDDDVTECDEGNNVAHGELCCPGEPDSRDGACCFQDGSCLDTTGPDCESMGGVFQGPETSCATTVCPVGDDCPDLIIEILEQDCVMEQVGGVPGQPRGFGATLSGTARVTNIGGAAATSSSIVVRITSPWGFRQDTVGPLGPSGDFTDVPFSWSFGWSYGEEPSCASGIDAYVDITEIVTECNDLNNHADASIDCPFCR